MQPRTARTSPSSPQSIEQFWHAHPRSLQRTGLLADALSDRARREIDGVEHELVRMLRFDVVTCQDMIGEVTQVERDDRLRMCPDRRRDHMAIVRIGRSSPDSRCSYPETMQSGTASPISRRVRPRATFGMSGLWS